jgi:hypothetical protein
LETHHNGENISNFYGRMASSLLGVNNGRRSIRIRFRPTPISSGESSALKPDSVRQIRRRAQA